MAAKERTAPWRYTGAHDAAGRPLEFFSGIPARDLTEQDVAGLSDDDYALVEASTLYAKKPAKADKE
jgi:hypothetical protein